MLRITDARTGDLVDAAPARRGLTRVEVHAQEFDPTNLRVLLVADLLVRALELGGTPVWALLSAEHRRTELRAAASALGVRPFEEGHKAGTGLGEAQVLHVVAEGGPRPDGVRIAAAPVGWDDRGAAHPAGPATAPTGWDVPGAPGGTDPAVLRLALLAQPRATPLLLGPTALGDAEDTLARWRRAVAVWAQRPSRPIPDEIRADLRRAWENDLDATGVLRVLRGVETAPEVPDGARFETYAYADRLLGLHLTRDLGAPQ
ncbi:hypothetical protein ACFYOV_23370 [Streptomyces sp. NPDC005931]|uniref:hypothetical protein n=1 Tax=Streptomyces sp. NPDC005931 TaxID=3364737 RepID=UPI0036926419